MFRCKICSAETVKVRSYVEHCRRHANLPRTTLPCCIMGCLKSCSTYVALRQHILRKHMQHGKESKLADIKGSVQCHILSCKARFSTVQGLAQHLQKHIREGVSVNCPVAGC